MKNLRMKNLLLATSALVAFSAGAIAADLPVRSAAPAPIFVSAPFSWTGFYVGSSVGFARGNNDFKDYDGWFDYAGENYGLKSDSVLLSVNAGYNWQFGALVVGLEADIGYLSADTTVAPYGNGYLISDYYIKAKMNALGSLRARFGYAFDRALLYVTAGLAFGNVDSSAYYTGYDVLKMDGWRTGYVVGAGLEYAFTNNWTARVEGLYYDLGEKKRQWNDVTVYFGGTEATALVARVGVNYKFGGSASPVVARY